jgi:hypothetical protein
MIRPISRLTAILLMAAGPMFGSSFPEESGLVEGFAVTEIDIAQTQGLEFGTLIAGPAGSVTITPEGVRTTAGVLASPASGFGASSFIVTIEGQGNPNYTITLPGSVNLNGPGGVWMRVDSFQRTATSGKVDPRTKTESFSVGATLHVETGQAAGSYTGVYPVTVHLGN